MPRTPPPFSLSFCLCLSASLSLSLSLSASLSLSLCLSLILCHFVSFSQPKSLFFPLKCLSFSIHLLSWIHTWSSSLVHSSVTPPSTHPPHPPFPPSPPSPPHVRYPSQNTLIPTLNATFVITTQEYVLPITLLGWMLAFTDGGK